MKPIKLICEFGVNWDNREQAYFMMGQAFALGIKHIKFQLFKKEDVSENLQHMCIDEELAQELVDTGKQYGQEVFFTPMYPEAVDICERIGVKYYKIRFFDRNNLILYRKLKKTKKPIFVSCQHPHDTIYKNMAKYQNRIHFLYCVPRYPAQFGDYGLFEPSLFQGVSDHTPDLELFQDERMYNKNLEYFEMHVCLNDKAYERKWSKTFDEIKEALK